MNKPNLVLGASAILVALGSGNVSAVEPQSITVAGMSFTPTLSLSEEYDDNVWNAPSTNANGEKSSWVTRVSPNFLLTAQDRLNVYQLSYGLTREEVHSSSEDSHTDHNASATAHLEFNARNRLDLQTGYNNVKARRDSTNNVFGETGNESESYNIGGTYGFGAKSATAQIELSANRGWLRYDNNFNTGSVTRERERDVVDLGAILYYRVAPKTRVLLEVQDHEYDYVSSASVLDGDSHIYRVGVTWEATAKTTGTIKVGREKKDFDAPGRSSVSNPSWDASIVWQPRTYSTFTLTSGSFVEEGSSTENHIETETTTMAWDHDWSSQLSSNINYTYRTQEYSGSSNDGRDDEVNNFGVGVNYKFRRWMDVGLHYNYYDTESNQAASEYDRDVIGLTIDLSL